MHLLGFILIFIGAIVANVDKYRGNFKDFFRGRTFYLGIAIMLIGLLLAILWPR